MEFKWKQIDDYSHELWGYEDIKIATLCWNEEFAVWELKSDWFKFNDELFDEDVKEKKESIKVVKLSTIEQLIDLCKNQLDWYRGQINMLNEVYLDTALN